MILGLSEYGLALALMLGQVLLFHRLSGEQVAWAPVIVLSFLLLLTLTAPILLAKERVRRRLLLGSMLLLTVIAYSDLIYHRFFGRAIPLRALTGFRQLTGVGGSIQSALNRADLLFLVAPLSLALVWLFVPLSKDLPPDGRPTRPRVAVAFLACLIGLAGTTGTASGLNLFSATALETLYNDNRVLNTGGAVTYRVADLMKQFQPTSTTADVLGQAAKIKRPTGVNLRGAAKGKNLIVIQLESTEAFPIGRSLGGEAVTPNLNRFREEAIWFPDFWAQTAGGNTSDAEFTALNSLFGLPAEAIYLRKEPNQYHSLPQFLAESGYRTEAFHAFAPSFWNRDAVYPQLGFQGIHLGEQFFTPGLSVNMGLADHLFFQQVATYLKRLPKPFFAFSVTLSGHQPFELPPELRTLRTAAQESDPVSRSYLENQHYVDSALGQFFDALKAAGLWESSVIVLYGDHPAKGVTEGAIQRFTGSAGPLDGPYAIELRKVPLMIRLPGGHAAGPRPVAGGQVDLFPTIVNLLGLSHQGNFYLGQDLLNPTETGVVPLRAEYPKGSFASKGKIFVAGLGGELTMGRCLDRRTHLLVQPTACAAGYEQALWKLSLSDQILETNGLPRLLKGLTTR